MVVTGLCCILFACVSGLILGLRPANERRRYKVTPSLIVGLGASLESALCLRSSPATAVSILSNATRIDSLCSRRSFHDADVNPLCSRVKPVELEDEAASHLTLAEKTPHVTKSGEDETDDGLVEINEEIFEVIFRLSTSF